MSAAAFKAKISSGVLFALFSAVLFGVSTPLSKILLGELSPVLLAGLLYLSSGFGLRVLLPEDHDTLGARIWRWLLVRCGSRWALAWIDKVEDYHFALSWDVMWLTMKVESRRTKLPR